MAELETILTPEVVRNYHVVNHEPENPACARPVWDQLAMGPLPCSIGIWLRRKFASLRGSSKPHFFAGFSGGIKGNHARLRGIAKQS